MNKRYWTYMDSKGHRTQIVMLHNLQNGNFLVSCGENIAVAEFNVLENKSFSFFLDEELFRIDVTRNGNEFKYHFETVMDADTPLNRKREATKKQRKKNSYIGLVIGIAIFAISALIVIGFIFMNQRHLKKLREKDGLFAIGTIQVTQTPNSYALSYAYEVPKRSEFIKSIEYYESPNPISPNGLPFFQNDEFNVLYARSHPNNHEIQYDNPTKKQLLRYHKRIENIYLEANPSVTDSLYCACLIQAAYDLKGLDGYADFYFQKYPPSQNKKHNIKTYLEFINTNDYREKAKNCEEELND